MSVVENKMLISHFIEAFWNAGDMGVADEVVAPGCMQGYTPFGPEEFKRLFAMARAGFPDLRFTVEDIFAEGDRVAVRFTERGTHAGEWWGVPPTGHKITVPGIVIYRIAGGRIVHQWSLNDFVSEMRQLGVAPIPAYSQSTSQALPKEV